MATTQKDMESFAQFVAERIRAGEVGTTLDELFDRWRLEYPSEELMAENITAIAASIDDFNRGERGSVLGTHSSELRRQFGLAEE